MKTSSVEKIGEAAIIGITDHVRGWDTYNMTINWENANTFVKHCVVEYTFLNAKPPPPPPTTTTTPNSNGITEEVTEENAVERAGESV